MTEIKMIVRSMTKSRVFCFVVLFGFSMGLACSALILSVLLRQTASDQFLRQDNQKSFRILMDNVLTGKRNVVTFGDLSGKLTDLYPEVIASSRVYTPKSCLIEYNGDETVGAKVIFSDPSFFKIFPYPVEGYTNKAITREAVFIKRSAIPNLFGDVQSVVNEIITIDGKAYHVAGIIADENRVSHLDFDLIGQIGSLSNNSDPFAYPGLTYISLPESVDENEFAAKINANVKNLVPPLPSLPGLYLQPVEEIYFGQRFEAFDNVLMYGSRDYLRILGLIAVVVLLVASINYLNLSYARSVSGFKRVAIQRILGVTSFKLFLNYFIESLAVILSSVL
jgi:putative ABC transport system permease protein